MALVVQKYGGSSLASPRHIRVAAKRIAELKRTNADVVVVVSAMGRITDHLIRLAHKTVAEPAKRELDMLLTAGERVSMALLAMALHEENIDAISFTGSQSGIVTTSDHNDAKIVEVRAFRIQEEIKKGKVVIVAGFQGISREKEITTLGRGGSDTTAVAIAATLKADLCEVLTDVSGIYTADPRKVKSAQLIRRCSYDEALELASLGAKMQSRSIEMARRYNVKVRVASSKPEHSNEFTEIGPESEASKMESTQVRGVATRDGYHFFRVKSDFGTFVKWLGETKISLRFFQASSSEMSFLVEEDKAVALKKRVSGLGEVLQELEDVSIVSVVGEGVSRCPDFLEKFTSALSLTDCQPLLLVSNALSITAAVPKKSAAIIAEKLHAEFLEKA